MRRSLAIAAAAFLWAAPAMASTPQSDLAERQAAAHGLLDPMVDQMAAETLAPLWESLRPDEFEADERVVLRTTFDRELVLVTQEIKDRLADVVARHVPLDEIRAEGMETPGWNAAGDEIEALMADWATGRGMELAARVIEAGCVVRATPSPACVGALQVAAQYRAGEITAQDVMAE